MFSNAVFIFDMVCFFTEKEENENATLDHPHRLCCRRTLAYYFVILMRGDRQ